MDLAAFLAVTAAIAGFGALLVVNIGSRRTSEVVFVAVSGAVAVAWLTWYLGRDDVGAGELLVSVVWLVACHHVMGVAASVRVFRSIARVPRERADGSLLPDVLHDGVGVARAHGFRVVADGATRLPSEDAISVALVDDGGVLADLMAMGQVTDVVLTSRTSSDRLVLTCSSPIFTRDLPPAILRCHVLRSPSLPEMLSAHRRAVREVEAAGHVFAPIRADEAVDLVFHSDELQKAHVMERPYRRAGAMYLAAAGWTGLRGRSRRTPVWCRDGPASTGD